MHMTISPPLALVLSEEDDEVVFVGESGGGGDSFLRFDRDSTNAIYAASL